MFSGVVVLVKPKPMKKLKARELQSNDLNDFFCKSYDVQKKAERQAAKL